MATALKLPYVLPPQIESVIVGNSITGEVEIPKYQDLTDEEEKIIDSLSYLMPDEPYKIAVIFASEIAKELGKGVRETALALMEADYEFYKGHFDKIFVYNDRVGKIRKARESVYKKIIATAIIAGRLVDGWTYEDTCDPEKISPRLVKLIADFGVKERDGWEDEDQDLKPDDGEDLNPDKDEDQDLNSDGGEDLSVAK